MILPGRDCTYPAPVAQTKKEGHRCPSRYGWIWRKSGIGQSGAKGCTGSLGVAVGGAVGHDRLNAALTLGTMDGANVEICQQVGDENIYIFGQTSDQVIHRYEMGDYQASQWVEGDPNIRRAVDFLVGPEMLAAGHEENLRRLHDELVWKDWFQTLPDFNAYVVRKGQALSDYACDPLGWRKKCVINIAKAGLFSSDRTIAEYNKDIWHLGE